MPTGAETSALVNGPCRMRPPKSERRANSSLTCSGLKSPNMPEPRTRCASVTVTLVPKRSATRTSSYHLPGNMAKKSAVHWTAPISFGVLLVREPGELDQVLDRRRLGHRDVVRALAAHHDQEALALRVRAASAQVVPASADALAIQVVQHAAAAHAFFIADDLAAVADTRDVERDLRHLFAGAAVADHFLVAHDMALGVRQVLACHGFRVEHRAAASSEPEGKNQRCFLE